MFKSAKGEQSGERNGRYVSTFYIPFVLRGDQRAKERICEGDSVNQPKSADDNDTITSKNWYIEYHPRAQVIPSKGCTTGNHGNTRPCYLCHHGNMIPSHNGCVKYTPIPLPARYSNMCYCVLCQQRSAQMTCNCHSCLRLRFEQTAASVLGPSEKNITIAPRLCYGGMGCERTEHMQYEICQCAQCLEREPRYHHNNVHIIHRHERAKVHVIQDNMKDPNNNDRKEQDEKESEGKSKSNKSVIVNGHRSPDVEVDSKENHQHPSSWKETANPRKRKYEQSEQSIFISKVIKTEKTRIEENPCINEKSLEENVKDEETEEEISSQERQNDEDIEYVGKGQEDRTKDHEDKVCVIESVINSCHKNDIDLKDEKEMPEDISFDKNRQHRGPNSRGRRHYNTRHTTNKSRSYETDFKVPSTAEWKQDKHMYREITKSRQRSKLNRLLANEHERRRVAQLNSAYQDLRQLIPGYQCDTKLPKIKILRYAINYIAHLDNILEVDSDK